jgi:hypothetical protein
MLNAAAATAAAAAAEGGVVASKESLQQQQLYTVKLLASRIKLLCFFSTLASHDYWGQWLQQQQGRCQHIPR